MLLILLQSVAVVASTNFAVIGNVTDVFYSGMVMRTRLNPTGKLPCIRGPGLVALPNAVLAFAECRSSTGDHCYPANTSAIGPTYICYRRSDTSGTSWGPLQALLPAANSSSFNYRAVYSRTSKRVIVHYSTPPEHVRPPPFGNRNFQVTSSDGLTWSLPESLQSQLGVICGRYLGTLGSAAEDNNGRLFMSAYHEHNPSFVTKGRTACLYASDDGGGSWRVLSYPHATPIAAEREVGPWEFSLAPIGDGKQVYLNGRRVNTDWSGSPQSEPAARIAGFSTNGGMSFDLRATTQPAVDPDSGGVHFSLLSVPCVGANGDTVLLAGPTGPAPFPHEPLDDRNNSGRLRMGLWLSDDDAISWHSHTLERDGYAGYSAMALLRGGLAFQTEVNTSGARNVFSGTQSSSAVVGLLYERGRVEASGPCEGSCSIGFLALELKNCQLPAAVKRTRGSIKGVLKSDDDDTSPSSFCDQAGWKRVWVDEFVGNNLDSESWSIDLGAGDSRLRDAQGTQEDVYVANGTLVLRTRRSSGVHGYSGQVFNFTSGAVQTRGKRQWKGSTRVCVMASLPGSDAGVGAGLGLWPAYWMAPDNVTCHNTAIIKPPSSVDGCNAGICIAGKCGCDSGCFLKYGEIVSNVQVCAAFARPSVSVMTLSVLASAPESDIAMNLPQDILEMVNGDGIAHGTYHWSPRNRSSMCDACADACDNGTSCSECLHPYLQGQINVSKLQRGFGAFHEYAVEYSSERIIFAVDTKPILNNSRASKNLPGELGPSHFAEFFADEVPYYLILNTAVAERTGSWPKPVASTTVLPAYNRIDYIRVSQPTAPSNTRSELK
eukprot:COSAG05_NODE_25_length_31349_cov_4.978560_20_plen_830_part_00